MSTQLDPEEVQALAEAMAAPHERARATEVSERDFRLPRRLSLDEFKKLETTLRNSIPTLNGSLARVLPTRFDLTPAGVREVTAIGLHDDVQNPFTIGEFRVGGAPGWIVWQQDPALACIQTALGMPELDVEPGRELTFIERRVLARLFDAVLAPLAGLLRIDAKDLRVVEKVSDLSSWQDEGADADAHRLCIELTLERGDDSSTVSVYLPGFHVQRATRKDAATPAGAAPPRHLVDVPVEVRAQFDSVEVPLGELLDLEVGDVIPLSPIRSSRVVLRSGPLALARARLGRHYERMAVSITEIIARPGADPTVPAKPGAQPRT